MIAVGDKVRLLDAAGEGIVRSISDDRAVVDMDGFDLEYALHELVKVEFDNLVKPTVTSLDKRAEEKLKAIHARKQLEKLKPARQAVYELDLHIHELLDRFEHMTNAQILEHQMACCRRFIAEAKSKRYKKVVLIHGVGEGVLRSEVRHWLGGQVGLEFHDAPYRTYGYGATEVILY